MKQRKKCYIYTRVSTSMQVDGYSLDAQKDKLRKYAEYEDMAIGGEYSDEGFSGKNIQGRVEFQRMLRDIQDCRDNVAYALVFKLSRFGRNAADVLNSLQLMQDYVVNLICVEDGIDSSMVNNPRFSNAIKEKIGIAVDTADMEEQLDQLRAQLRQTLGTKNRLERQMDALDIEDAYYERKISDLQRRYDEQYGKIEEIENQIEEVQEQIRSIRQDKISGDNIYQLLLAFDQVYGSASEVERKEFMRAFIERIEIYSEKPENGCWIRKIIFNFPVPMNGQEVKELPLENETMLETVVLLSKVQN